MSTNLEVRSSWYEGVGRQGLGSLFKNESSTPLPTSGGARGVLGGARGVLGGARGVVAIVVGNGHGDTSSNPGRDWLHFT